MSKIRIQKYLSDIGVASRRAIEEMIIEGRITVDGSLVAELPCFVTEASEIRLDGKPVRRPHGGGRKLYFLLNKPRGVVCTQSDPQGRPRAVDLLPEMKDRVYCVGRLDAESTGVIVLTNDGELTQHLTHPSHGVEKTYVVEVEGRIDGGQIDRLKKGVWLDGKRTAPAKVKVLRRNPKRSLLEIRLSEGRNREIRRSLARLGHKVRRLKRTAIGRITHKGLKIGNFRMLKSAEVASLRRSGAGQDGKTRKNKNTKNTKPQRERKK